MQAETTRVTGEPWALARRLRAPSTVRLFWAVDSVAAEDAECRTKAAAVLNAIAVAGTFSDV